MIPKLTFAAFVAFWSAILTLTTLWAVSPAVIADADVTQRAIPLAELEQHATLDDCWMAVEGNVYDLTDYVPQHPTPPAVLAPWCGREATEGMRTKGYGRDHSPGAWAMLDGYLIGSLE